MVYKIGVLGPLNIDLIIRGNAPTNLIELNQWSDLSEVHCITAGAAGYVSQNLKKLGNEIHLVSCVGDDPFGVMILSALEKLGINPEHILVEKDTEGAIAIFILLFGNKKRPLTYRLPTHHGWPPIINEQAKSYLLDCDLLHSAGYLHFPELWTEDILNLYKEAKENGVKTSIDPQFPLTQLDPPWINVLKPLAKYVDIIMVDENEALNITGQDIIEDAANFLHNEGFETVAIKLGSEGVCVKNCELLERIPAIPSKIFVDSIGAGDSFDAGFLQGILEGKDVKKAALMGVTAATMSIEGSGGTETFPTRDELIF